MSRLSLHYMQVVYRYTSCCNDIQDVLSGLMTDDDNRLATTVTVGGFSPEIFEPSESLGLVYPYEDFVSKQRLPTVYTMDSIQQIGSSADCDDGLFGCFNDCCTRAIQFCNSREKRCQDCSLRQAFCGKNQTYVPLECDLYCYQQQQQHEQTRQSEWILWAGWIVAAVLAIVIIVWCLYKGCKSSRCFHRSSSESSLLSVSSDEVDVVTETQERGNADNTELKKSDSQKSDNVGTFADSRLAGVPPTTPEHDGSELVVS